MITRRIKNIFVKNKDISIISNNCVGADISHSLALRFNSPTVNLQILPAYFSRFCADLDSYMHETLTEAKKISDSIDEQIYRTYQKQADELSFPIGFCGDIPICFQHYTSFIEAKDAWERRRKRVNFDNLGFIMLEGAEFAEEFKEFDKINVSNKLAFAVDFDLHLGNTEVINVITPNGEHFMDRANYFQKYYEVNFNAIKWVNHLTIPMQLG